MRLHSALLAAIAPIAVVSGAQAADLPTKKAAPVEYVRVCSVHGAGFWYIPGTDTCIRISGRARAEFLYATPEGRFNPSYSFGTGAIKTGLAAVVQSGRDVDATGFEANGRLNFDARTSTEWGTLRAFIRYDFYRSSGPFVAGSSSLYTTNYANGSTPGCSISAFATSSTCANDALDKAYIQWAGITAGRATSFFDFYANTLNWTKIAGSDRTTQMFAYTATFGGGFSATLSIEDQTETKRDPRYALPIIYQGFVDGDAYYFPWVSTTTTPLGGTRVPDIVANLRYDGSWGSAQLSGALHQSTFSSLTNASICGVYPGAACDILDTPNGYTLGSEYGWAVQAGVKINLPMLAKGDQLWLQAAYADGAISYLSPRFTSFGSAQGQLTDQWLFPVIDGNGEFVGYQAKSATGYALTAAGLHYWTPTIRQAIFGSYLKIDNPTGSVPNVLAGPTFDYFSYGRTDVTVWQVGSNVIWSPVSGLDIGLEVGYINTDAGDLPLYSVASGAGETLNRYYVRAGAEDRWYARFRVERNF